MDNRRIGSNEKACKKEEPAGELEALCVDVSDTICVEMRLADPGLVVDVKCSPKEVRHMPKANNLPFGWRINRGCWAKRHPLWVPRKQTLWGSGLGSLKLGRLFG